MSLANPWGLLALLAIPLVLYLHRRMAGGRRTVTLVRLWRPASPRAAPGARRRRVDLILAVRLMIVIGVALALANPTWPVEPVEPHVFILDASASMGAREIGQQMRFARAIESAGRLLDRLPAAAPVMLIRGDVSPTVVHPFSRDRRSLRAALSALAPGAAAKDLMPGLSLARQTLAGGPGVVDVFSDLRSRDKLLLFGQRLGFTGGAIELHPVGGPAENLAIVRLAAAPLPRDPLDTEVFAQVANFSKRERIAEVSLLAPEGLRERRRLMLSPGELQPIVFITAVAPWVEVRLEDAGDGLPIDDRAVVVLPVAPLQVLLVSRGDRFLEAALRAHPGLRVERVPGADLRAEHWSARPGSASPAEVAVFDRMAPPPGFPLPALVVGSEASSRSGQARAVPVTDWQRRHPLLQQLDLSEVLVPAGAVLAGSGPSILIRSADGPVARVSQERGLLGLRRVELAFPVADSNLGRLPAFPVLMARTLDWLAAPRGTVPQSLQPGQPLEVALKASEPMSLTVRRPDGSLARVEAEAGRLRFTATELTGRYLVEGPGVQLSFAVNLLDPEESDVDRAPAASLEAESPAVSSPPRASDVIGPLLALALLFLSLEIWLMQRGGKPARP